MSVSLKNKVKGRTLLEGAGVKVNRLIGSPELDVVDPFVLLDEFKSENPDDYTAGFPTHPHRGIETVTYMLHGSFRHKDSKGGGGLLTDGCVQWMTAGGGILHSEMPEKGEGLNWGYQLWINLPAKHKMTPARYQHLSPETIPSVEKEGVTVNVISGRYEGVSGPAENLVPTRYLDVRLKKGNVFEIDLEAGANAFLFTHTGTVLLDTLETHDRVFERELAVLEGSGPLSVKGLSDQAGFLLLSAPPNNEPIVKGGPFVMNTRQEILQAYEDYQQGRLG